MPARPLMKALAVVFVLAATVRPARADECTGPLKLQFDAATAKWEVTNAEQACKGLVEMDVNSKPTVYVGKSMQVQVTIIHVNPLLYSARFGEITLESISIESDLKALFLSVGTFIQAIAREKSASPRVARGTPLEEAVATVADSLAAFEAERVAIIHAAQLLEFSVGMVPVRAPGKDLEGWYRAYGTLRQEFNKLADAERGSATPVVARARTLLDAELTAMKGVAAIRILMQSVCGDKQSCEVSRAMVMPEVARASDWNKIATYPVKINRDSAIAELVATALPKEIATSFRLADAGASTIGVDIGIVTSSVTQKTWKAVADPNNPQKVVTRTSSERFAAVPALTATWAFTRQHAKQAIHTFAEFGASVDTGKPAWFAGVGLALGSAIRVGFGLAAARTDHLNGQTEGVTVVADDNAIKTRKDWSGGWYWSLGISLSGLPFFSK